MGETRESKDGVVKCFETRLSIDRTAVVVHPSVVGMRETRKVYANFPRIMWSPCVESRSICWFCQLNDFDFAIFEAVLEDFHLISSVGQ
jgi:hypothetical protein